MPNAESARIVIDGSPLRYLHTGLGQFSFHLLQELSRLPFPEARLFVLVHPDFAHLVPAGISLEPASWLRRHAPPQIQRHLFAPCSVWHMTTENTKLVGAPSGARVVLTIHGLHFLDEMNKADAARELKNVQCLVDRATVIAAVSRFTADLVREKLNTGDKDIRIIPNGISRTVVAPAIPSWAPTGRFFFSIGTFFERKNIHVLIPMMKFLPEFTLVLAGDVRGGYGKQIEDQVHAEGMGDRILMPGEVTESEKQWLYQQGEALFFPSVSEGFGIPLIEAFQQGKPVFCGRFGSLPEIGADHAYFWNDFEPEHMAAKVREKLLLEPKVDKSQRVTYADQFSWSSTARAYQKIYRSLM